MQVMAFSQNYVVNRLTNVSGLPPLFATNVGAAFQPGTPRAATPPCPWPGKAVQSAEPGQTAVRSLMLWLGPLALTLAMPLSRAASEE